VTWGISGKKTQEGPYKNDKRDGLWINYGQGGKGSHRITYQNGIEAKE
jgi:antitoxin component YwqK of YwqJK toxin-antitoxin module